MIDIRIIGETGATAKVSSLGQLVVGPLAPNLAEFNELGTIDTAFNFYKPRSGKQFIITHIFAFGDKQVSPTTNATVEVYEATSDATTTVDRTLLKFEIGQNQFQPYQDINILVNSGAFMNAKTDDDDVHMNILGFYIDKLD